MNITYRHTGFGMLTLLACIAVGFQKTYFGAWPRHFSDISAWVHFHVAAAMAWAVLLIAQPLFLRSGQARAHRFLGKMSYVLFPLMLISTAPLLFFSWLKGDPAILLAGCANAALLLIFYVLAIWFRKKPVIHARFMIATGLVLLDPTLGRAANNFFQLPPAWGNHLPFLATDLTLLALIFFDRKSGRNFRPYLAVLACFLAYQSAAYFTNFKIEKTLQSFPSPSFPMDYAKIENTEITAWIDLFAAQPEVFRRDQGAETTRVEGVFVATCQKIPFPHFNVVLDLGVEKLFSESQLDTILAYFKSRNCPKFYLQTTPVTQPADAPDWFARRGLRHVSSWHRIARANQPLGEALHFSKKYEVEEISAATAGAWADFIDQVYGMPTKVWLLELVGRTGWSHVVARDESGKIVAARSMKINPNSTAYFCIDAPVPGIMTQNFEADYLLARRLVEIGLEKARNFLPLTSKNPPCCATRQRTDFGRRWASRWLMKSGILCFNWGFWATDFAECKKCWLSCFRPSQNCWAIGQFMRNTRFEKFARAQNFEKIEARPCTSLAFLFPTNADLQKNIPVQCQIFPVRPP